MNSVQNALEQAKALAAQAGSALPVAMPAAMPMMASVAGVPMARPTAEGFINSGGIDVDGYFKVSAAGIKIDDMKGYFENIDVEIDTSEIAFFWGIRKTVNNQASYAKTYDGISTPRGENFAQVVQSFKAVDPNASEYRGADIPCTLLDDLVDPKDKAKVFSEGDTFGLTTSVTGFKLFQKFAKKLEKAGLWGETVRVRLQHDTREKPGVQPWGVVQFELLDELLAEAA